MNFQRPNSNTVDQFLARDHVERHSIQVNSRRRRKRSVIQSDYVILNSGALLIIADIVMRRHNMDGRNSLRVTFAYVTYANAVFGGNTE